MIAWSLQLALAAPSAPVSTARGARTVKVDLFLLDPRAQVWGTDWKVTLLEQWTAVLACAPVREEVERCRFVDGVWWSVVVAGTTEVRSIKLAPPGELEWSWTPRGRLKAWDVIGDRELFWTDASSVMLREVFHRPDMVFKPDAQREIGAEIERSLTRGLAGALEWEQPKDPAAVGSTWKPTQTPWVGRRWLQSTSSPKIVFRSSPGEGGAVRLDVEGTVSEAYADGSVSQRTVTTTLLGSATWDPAVGGVIAAQVETVSAPGVNQTLVGHARTVTLVTPWQEGDPTTPADLPPQRLR